MVGRSYEETISLLVKALKNAEVHRVFLDFARLSLLAVSLTRWIELLHASSVVCL